MRNMLCAAALLSIALVGAGCKKSPTIVGKWTGAMNNQTGEFEFKPDNTMSITAKQGAMQLTFTGDYKVDGETIGITMKDVDIKGAPKGLDEMLKTSMKKQVGKEEKSKFKFVSDDEVSLTSDKGTAITLKRVKEGA